MKLFPFRRSNEKTPPPDKTPIWFRWMLGLFVGYAVITNLLSDKAAEVHKNDQKPGIIDFAPLLRGRWGEAPEPFHVQDIQKGEGLPAVCWDKIAVRYQLFRAPGQAMESNMKDKTPAQIRLGSGTVPPGLERGLLGAQLGMIRHITSRPEQAFNVPGFSHGGFAPNDAAGWVVRIVGMKHPGRLPQSDFGLRLYDETIGTGRIAQCTDDVHIRAEAFDVTGKKLWRIPKDYYVHIGRGDVPYAIERGVMGMKEGGKRTMIAPPGFMEPVFGQKPLKKTKKEANSPLPVLSDSVIILNLELIAPEKKI